MKGGKRQGQGASGDEEIGTWAWARRADALRRDFTVNALFFDPFAGLVYDYVVGVRDCQSRSLRCIKPASQSFQEDPARILRAIRHASRSGAAIAPA